MATVDLGPENYDTRSAFDGLKAVFMGIQTTPDANPLTVINEVRDSIPGIQRLLPTGLEANIAYDATEFINASIWEVGKTLLEAGIIVIIVIFLFLGNVRSTIIPVVTIPLSLIGVALILVAFGYSINLLTLLALVLAIGLVVDSGILMILLALVLVAAVAMVVAAAYNWTIERLAYKPLRGSFRLAPLISAIGMSIVLQEFVRVNQEGRPKPVQPIVTGGYEIMRRATEAGEFIVRLTNMQILIIVSTLILMAVFTILIQKTSLGQRPLQDGQLSRCLQRPESRRTQVGRQSHASRRARQAGPGRRRRCRRLRNLFPTGKPTPLREQGDLAAQRPSDRNRLRRRRYRRWLGCPRRYRRRPLGPRSAPTARR